MLKVPMVVPFSKQRSTAEVWTGSSSFYTALKSSEARHTLLSGPELQQAWAVQNLEVLDTEGDDTIGAFAGNAVW